MFGEATLYACSPFQGQYKATTCGGGYIFTCNDPLDPWSANCVVPNLLFDDIKQFEKHFPFQQIHHSYSEFLMLLISGGVTAKTKTINFSSGVLNWIDKIDDFLIKLNKNIFALQRQIVLRNKK